MHTRLVMRTGEEGHEDLGSPLAAGNRGGKTTTQPHIDNLIKPFLAHSLTPSDPLSDSGEMGQSSRSVLSPGSKGWELTERPLHAMFGARKRGSAPFSQAPAVEPCVLLWGGK